MTKGLFTSSEEIKFQMDYKKPIAHPSIEKEKKFKPLFSSLEEISFQHNYVEGNAPKAYDPNTRRNPTKTKHLSSKDKSRKLFKVVMGRIR